MVLTREIALLQPAARISSDVTTANAFRGICNAAVRPNATTRPTNPLATVSVFPPEWPQYGIMQFGENRIRHTDSRMQPRFRIWLRRRNVHSARQGLRRSQWLRPMGGRAQGQVQRQRVRCQQRRLLAHLYRHGFGIPMRMPAWLRARRQLDLHR